MPFIVESTHDRDHILWHAKTGEYCPEEGSINGVTRFGKVDKAYIEWNSFLPRQLLQPTNYKHHIGGRMVRSETTLFLRQDPHALTVLAGAASDDLQQQYLACVRHQRDAPVVAALCPILLFVEYHDDGIFPLLRHLAPPPNTNDDIEQSPAQGGITVDYSRCSTTRCISITSISCVAISVRTNWRIFFRGKPVLAKYSE